MGDFLGYQLAYSVSMGRKRQ